MPLTRSSFVEGYMTRSRLTPYTLNGNIVSWAADSGETFYWSADPCKCGDESCEGWAMNHIGEKQCNT